MIVRIALESAASGGSLLPDLLKVAATGAVAVLTFFIGEAVKNRRQRRIEERILDKELEDLARHCARNADVCRTILTRMGAALRKPRLNHLHKLRVPTTAVIFSDDNLRHQSDDRARRVHRARFRLRNVNLDVDEALRVAEKGSVAELACTIEYIAGRFEDLATRLPKLFTDQWTNPPGQQASVIMLDGDIDLSGTAAAAQGTARPTGDPPVLSPPTDAAEPLAATKPKPKAKPGQ